MLAAVLFAAAAALDTAAVARVDASVTQVMTAARVPSIVVAVSRDGETVYSHAYGYANVASRVPASVDTHYEIGSITKQFTATAILQLKESGKLSLDDTLARWIPEYRPGAKVTIRQLLGQTTGIPNYTAVKGFVEIASTRPASFAAILALVRGKPLEFAPGSQFRYSNTNYILLGEIVERASKQSWESYVRTRLFAPAGMTHSGFIADEARLQPMATGYKLGKSGAEPAPKFGSGWAWSAGAIVSTVGDMLAWDSALFRGRLINATDLAAMLAPGKNPAFGKDSFYGYGWVIDTADGRKRIWHNGGTFGFMAANLVFPRDQTVVVVLQNALSLASTESTAQRVFEALEPSAAPALKPAAGENPTITARAREWIGRLESGNIDRSQLGTQMNALLTPKFVGQVKDQLAVLGAPQQLVYLGKRNAGKEGTVYTYRAVFAVATFTLHFDVDPAGKIGGILLGP